MIWMILTLHVGTSDIVAGVVTMIDLHLLHSVPSQPARLINCVGVSIHQIPQVSVSVFEALTPYSIFTIF